MNAAPGACPTPRRVTVHHEVLDVRCAKRSCPSCGVLWLQDSRIRAVAAAHELRGSVALVTVTAPGVAWLPWEPGTSRVEPLQARLWNRSAPTRWSGLHREAARAARRSAKRDGAEWRLLFKAWEFQKRGVLHLHLVVPFGSPAERRASTAYVNHLHARRKAWLFGYVDRGKLPGRGARRSTRELSPTPPHRAAAYVASYIASTGAGKGGIAEVARKQGVPGPVLYVTQPLTTASGVTMRSLRARRRVTCQWPGAARSVESWRAACVLDALGRGRPPIAPDTRGALMEVAMAQRWEHTVDLASGEVRGPTQAPLPSVMRSAASPPPPPGTHALVRLDSVLNRSHESQPPRHLTYVGVLDLADIPSEDVRGTPHETRPQTRPATSPARASGPSDTPLRSPAL